MRPWLLALLLALYAVDELMDAPTNSADSDSGYVQAFSQVGMHLQCALSNLLCVSCLGCNSHDNKPQKLYPGSHIWTAKCDAQKYRFALPSVAYVSLSPTGKNLASAVILLHGLQSYFA